MALRLYSTLNWSAVPDQCCRIIKSPPAATPQLLTATAIRFPGYSSVNATASCAYSSPLNSKRQGEAVNADPFFFSKGCNEYNISHDARSADDDCYMSYPDYHNHDSLLNPAAADFFSPAIGPPTLGSCYEIYDLRQQLFLGLHDDHGLNLDQFCNYQAPPQPPKRYKPCYFDDPELLFAPNIPHPPVRLPQLNVDDRDVERTRPRPRRVLTQSLVARERRKKITDKTQQLGKLVPGGSRMNTAEMLESTFNYVKFLQSQVHILQLVSSLNPSKESDRHEEGGMETEEEKELLPSLLGVVASPAVQEKLYKEASCIIPRSLARALVHYHPHLQDLQQLL